MLFQNVCAAIVQNKVATAAARVAAVALLEGGPLNNFEPDIDLILRKEPVTGPMADRGG